MLFTVMSKLLNLKPLTLNNSTKCSSTLEQNSITNPFQVNVPFPYSMKTSETCDFLFSEFSDVFRGYRNGTLTWSSLISHDWRGTCPPHEFLNLLTTNYIFLYSFSTIDSTSVLPVFSLSLLWYVAGFEILVEWSCFWNTTKILIFIYF